MGDSRACSCSNNERKYEIDVLQHHLVYICAVFFIKSNEARDGTVSSVPVAEVLNQSGNILFLSAEFS